MVSITIYASGDLSGRLGKAVGGRGFLCFTSVLFRSIFLGISPPADEQEVSVVLRLRGCCKSGRSAFTSAYVV
jgi:hypothetical protein